MSTIPACPLCLRGRITDGECTACSRTVRTRRGVPSVTDCTDRDPRGAALRELARLEPADSLAGVHRALREGRLDEAVVDRFYERRTAGWRLLLEPVVEGRALVVGAHDASLPLALAEVLNAVWVVDTSLDALAALDAVAAAEGLAVHPVHASIDELPFPAGAFDLVVLRPAPGRLSRALDRTVGTLARDGRLALVVDGWIRELGIAARLGLAASDGNGRRARVAGAIDGVPRLVERRLARRGLSVERTCALLSRGRRENELAFDAGSDAAIAWLLDGFDATARGDEFGAVRRLTRLAARSGLLAGCYPRYLFVCGRPPVESVSTDAVLVAGRNRTTVLELDRGANDGDDGANDGDDGANDGGVIQPWRVRKVPNSRRHAAVNAAASEGTRTAATVESIVDTIPAGATRTTAFGPERVERPVGGTPLDALLDDRPRRFARCLDVAFDWLERLQLGTRSGTIRKAPATVAADLADERFGPSDSCGIEGDGDAADSRELAGESDAMDSPAVDRPIELPRVLVHGDFAGSNLFVDDAAGDWRVSGVIDWEWATPGGNPIVDAGFLVLESAGRLRDDFERGFERAFLAESPLSSVAYERLAAYGETVGVEPRALATYLPIGYLERARADVRLNGRLDVDWPQRARLVRAHRDEIERRLVAARGGDPGR